MLGWLADKDALPVLEEKLKPFLEERGIVGIRYDAAIPRMFGRDAKQNRTYILRT